jgi:hypothetical protein
MPLSTPWGTTTELQQIVIADVFGLDPLDRPLTRAEAMRIPAVARARHVICGTIGRVELGGYRGDTRLLGADEPSWIGSVDDGMSPFHRMLWTCDDLLFYGWSLWRITQRAAPSSGGFPLRMSRVPMGQWQLEPDTGRVLTYQGDGRGGWVLAPAPAGSFVLIPGIAEGLLVDGAGTLRHARDVQRAAHNAAKHPAAYLALCDPNGKIKKQTSDDPSEITVDTVLSTWRTARNNPEGGGVAFAGGLDLRELGTFDAHLLESGRNAAAVDVARQASIPADLLDATVSESSLHYSTSRDNDRRAVDYGFGFYMSAISGRLSLDDVTPRGQRVAFDLERWLEGAGSVPGQAPAAPAPGLATQQAPTDQETPA